MTFLFTDIEDSTRLWEEAPTDMADGLRVHDAIVRGTIERHGGYVFGTGGDGFCAAFSTAADAAAAAIESQEQLRDDPAVTFSVRMGLHTGEAVERDRNYFGSEVNRAARLMSLAHGGQVLVSGATEVLLGDRVALRPLGEHRLRGLRGRMAVYQIVAAGLPTDFPVLRSVDDLTGNLPQQLSSLVGREDLVAEVAELVRSSRLVTLTGVGGVGKTRLALEVGAELAGEFPDGVWVVELASVGDPDSVPPAIATVLGITPQADSALIDTVAEALGGRRLLLVLDNCEHVLAAAGAATQAILARSRDVRVLATSRESLAVDGEAVLTVPPLALAGGVTSDAVTLFVDRARAVRPNFGLAEPEAATAAAEICETLDGLPLGIELAAARMAAMGVVEVRDRLADRFRLLQGSTPGPERQLTLRNAVEWSYDLLDDDERELLRLTSVFAGGFDLTSICAVVDAADDVDVLRSLDSLVRKSLVVADHAASRTRYSLFETIRQFAEDRLAEAGSLERTRDRHAELLRPRVRRSVGALERARLARRRRLGGDRARQPARRLPVERRARLAGGGDRHRRARGAHGLLGAAVRDAGLGRGAARARVRRRRPPPSPAVHGRRLRVLRGTGGGGAGQRAPSDRARGRRPLRRLRARVRLVRRGARPRVLRRPRPLRRAHRCGRPRVRIGSGLRPGRVRRRPPVVRPDRRGARAHRGVRRRREDARQPVLDRLRALDRRHGVLQGRRTPRLRGVGRGRRLRA